MAAVRIHYKNRTTIIPVKMGDKVRTIKNLALRRFDLEGREGRLSVRDTGYELLDSEAIEGAPGLPIDVLYRAISRTRTAEPATPISLPLGCQPFTLDESQFEVLRDPSLLGPPFEGDPNSPAGFAHRLARQRKFQTLLRADFAANVDRERLKHRIERILACVEEDVKKGRVVAAGSQSSRLDSRPEPGDDSDQSWCARQNLKIVLELRLQAPCFGSIFRTLVSPELPEEEEWSECGTILIGFEEGSEDVCGLLARVLSTDRCNLVIGPVKPPHAVPKPHDPHRNESALRVQRVGRSSVPIRIEREPEVRIVLDFGWSLGEVQWAIRRFVPQLRRVQFALYAGRHDLLTTVTPSTPLGHVYLGIQPLVVKIALDYGCVPMQASRQTLVPQLTEEEEEALEGPQGTLNISRVVEMKEFLQLQTSRFQTSHAERYAHFSLRDLVRELTEGLCIEDRGEMFEPARAAVRHSFGREQVFLRLPPRSLFYVQVAVREPDTGCVHSLPWVLPNTKLHVFQDMLSEVCGVSAENQSLTFAGRSLHAVDREVTLQKVGIRKDAEMELQRSVRIQLREAVSGVAEEVRVSGHLRTLMQLRLQLQSRLGIDQDVLRLQLRGTVLPKDGLLTDLGIGAGAVLEWHRPLRVTFCIDAAPRCDLVIYPEDPVQRLVDFANARRGEEGKRNPVKASALELRVLRPSGAPGRLKLKDEQGSLLCNGITFNFDVILRAPKRLR